MPYHLEVVSHAHHFVQLNLEVPQYDFNDAEGKLVIG